jgi:hypothetical protein
MLQLFVHCRGSGAFRASPPGAFASAHAASVAICAGVNDGSFEKRPTFGSANHGGIDLSCAARRMAPANGLVSSYVSNAIGAMPLA